MIILKDIAQMAGVNISTVSRALNDSNEVSDEKKTRNSEHCSILKLYA